MRSSSKRPLVILVSGYKRAGKDYFAKLLATELTACNISSEQFSYAAPMKQIIASTFGILLEDLNKFKNEPNNFHVRTIEDPYGIAKASSTTNFRTILQRFGSEAMKPVFGDSVWGSLMVDNLRKSHTDVVIIPDYRFDVESDCLRNCGFLYNVVRVNGPTVESADTHVSEQLPTTSPDFIIDNSSQNYTIDQEVTRYAEYIKVLL